MKSVLPICYILIALFSSGHLQAADAESEPSWIWSKKDAAAEEVVYIRKTFGVPSDTERVLILLAADNKFEAYVNGEKRPVAKGEQWEKWQVADVTSIVEKGSDNSLAIRAENSGGAAGTIALIEIIRKDGSKLRVGSDGTWRVSTKGRKGWNRPGFGEESGEWNDAVEIAALGSGPWGKVDSDSLATALDVRMPQATAVGNIKLAEGFQAELLYSVPKSEQGSWVAMTLDDKERLIVSDQYGSLYRFDIPALGGTLDESKIEKIDLDIGGAQGLLHAFDSLYCVLNTQEHGGRGLYRLQDTDGDDLYDKKTLLRKFDEVGGEHGPHAVLLGPDEKSIYVVNGNQTPLTELDSSRVPQVWDEDLLLDRPIGRGFMKGTPAPGGWIAKTDPEGKKWELLATGFRNQYDAAFDHAGELFTYDADMEWDINTPWYRPTRINHVTSGAEFGWRNGGGKWPAYYADSLPAVVDVGPGSPTGVAFGYGAKFPAKYQKAFYAADWSYGKLYAVHLEPEGASYKGKVEEFMSAQPLPLTDLLVNPNDGAMYVAIGGRRVQSGLYRVTYVGNASTAVATYPEATPEFELRKELEAMHRPDPLAVKKAWSHLSSPDRFVRYAARIAIEHQPVGEWQEKALSENDPTASVQAIIALARHGEAGLQSRIIEALDQTDWTELSRTERLDLIRAYSLAFTRMGEGTPELRAGIAQELNAHFPAGTPELNAEMLQLLVYLQSPDAAEKGIALLREAPSQEEQMAYAKSLRHLKEGWSLDLRRDFFQWFTRASGYKGGASFSLFIENMKKTALENTPEDQKVALKETIDAEPPKTQSFTYEVRPFVKAWTVEDFDDVINVGLEGGRDYANGRKMFGGATCFACHRFDQEGGAIGPDLTSVAGKFSPRDLLDSIINPSREISDQYGQMIFEMNDGSSIIGRIMNLNGDNVQVNVNMMDPNNTVHVDRKKLKEMRESPVSMMPPGLVNTLEKDDVLDLLAYLLSQGNPDDPLFAE